MSSHLHHQNDPSTDDDNTTNNNSYHHSYSHNNNNHNENYTIIQQEQQQQSPPPSPRSNNNSSTSSSSSSSSSMERVLFNLHKKVSNFVLRTTSFNFRLVIEHCILIIAVCCMCLLALLHLSFVYHHHSHSHHNVAVGDNSANSTVGRPTPLSCLKSISEFYDINNQADVTHIVLVDDAYYSDNNYCAFNATSNSCIPSSNNSTPSKTISTTSIEQQQGKRKRNNKNNNIFLSYSKVKGFLYLAMDDQQQQQQDQHENHFFSSYHNITQRAIKISKNNPLCFGEPFLQTVVFNITQDSYTVVLNWLLAAAASASNNENQLLQLQHPKTGLFIHNPRTNNVIELDKYASDYSNFFLFFGGSSNSRSNNESNNNNVSDDEPTIYSLIKKNFHIIKQTFLVKLGIMLTSLFLFFITTTLVSFILRETQSRMLMFTFTLQLYVSRGIPHYHLIFTHVVESLVFVPIMVGMMFFLIEFYRDEKFVAFIILSIVWICEVFSIVALRTQQGMRFFPRVFFLLFILFHVYFFSCPFGFTYTALVTTIMFMIHSMVFFWNRFELPAVANGLVTHDNPRMNMMTTINLTTVLPPSSPTTNNTTDVNNNNNRNTMTTINDINSNSNSSNTVNGEQHRNPLQTATTTNDSRLQQRRHPFVAETIIPTSSSSSSRISSSNYDSSGNVVPAAAATSNDDGNANNDVNTDRPTQQQQQQQSQQQGHLPPISSSMRHQQRPSSSSSFVPLSADLNGGGGSASRAPSTTSGRGSAASIQFQQSADSGDDDSSYMFFMDGEVVMHRDQRRHHSQHSDQLSSRSASPTSTPQSRTSSITLPSPTGSLESLAEGSGGLTTLLPQLPFSNSLDEDPRGGNDGHGGTGSGIAGCNVYRTYDKCADGNDTTSNDDTMPHRKSTTESLSSMEDTRDDEDNSIEMKSLSIKRSSRELHQQQKVTASRSTTPPTGINSDGSVGNDIESKISNTNNNDFDENTLTPLIGSATRQCNQHQQQEQQRQTNNNSSLSEKQDTSSSNDYADEDPQIMRSAPLFPFFSFGNDRKKQKR